MRPGIYSTIALILLTGILYGQKADSVHLKLTGKWLLVKHLITDGGKTSNELGANNIYTYQFMANGNYTVSYANKVDTTTTTYVGKWKIGNSGKTIVLFNNSLPAEPKQLVADRSLPIIKLTAKEFVTRELLFAEDMHGISYYKRQ